MEQDRHEHERDTEREQPDYLELARAEGQGQDPAHEECIICGEPKSEGIRICLQFICEECEAEIVRTDALDVRYPYFISQMKRIWYKESS